MTDDATVPVRRVPPARREAQAVLRKHWGHDDFRPGQWEVIEAVLSGRDALAVLPTGTGKSVCYQLPAIMTSDLTLVVSPLIALMRDQVHGLSRRGIPATYIDSTLSQREIDQRLTDAEYGKYRMLYVAPERLSSETFRIRAERFRVGLVVVDEAHCVSEWGHSFRPSYLGIAEAVSLLGRPVVVALTATATPQVRADIRSLVGLRNPEVIVTGFDRPNIEWAVHREDEKRRRVRSILHRSTGSAVLYVGTRRGAEEWDAWLRSTGFTSVHYHGGLPSDRRESAQSRWMSGDARVIVATSAFGMGIDKPDVRHVIHVDLPLSLEAYYQEAGRAGRDGEPSRATLIFRDGDERLPNTLIDTSFPTADQVSKAYESVCSLGQVAVGGLPEGPVDVVLQDVARVSGVKVASVRQAIEHLERTSTWVAMPEGEFGYLRLITDPESLRSFLAEDHPDELRRLIEHLLRGDRDVYHSWARIRPSALARRLEMKVARLEQVLRYLDMAGHLKWRGPGATMRIVFLEARRRSAPVHASLLDRSREGARRRLDDLIRYVKHRGCRRNYILTYFGESSPARCGRCDNCRGVQRQRHGTALDRDMIRSVLAAVDSGVDLEQWTLDSSWTEEQVDACIDWMTGEGYVRATVSPHFRLELTDRGRRAIA